MRNFFSWVSFYTLIMAFSQILLKLGTNQIGTFAVKEFKDILYIGFQIIKNPYIISSVVLMSSSFFLWLYILSWFKLGLVFPLTAMTYVFVALMSLFIVGEKLTLLNYFGVLLIASGVVFLLYK